MHTKEVLIYLDFLLGTHWRRVDSGICKTYHEEDSSKDGGEVLFISRKTEKIAIQGHQVKSGDFR